MEAAKADGIGGVTMFKKCLFLCDVMIHNDEVIRKIGLIAYDKCHKRFETPFP